MTLGKRIREMRVARGITQEALAAQAGVSQATLSRIEMQQVTPSGATAERVAAALGIELRRLEGLPPRTVLRPGEARRLLPAARIAVEARYSEISMATRLNQARLTLGREEVNRWLIGVRR